MLISTEDFGLLGTDLESTDSGSRAPIIIISLVFEPSGPGVVVVAVNHQFQPVSLLCSVLT